MDDVKRFKIEFQPSGEVRACVYADDFDAQRLRADTAEAERERLEDEFDTLENTNTTIKLKLADAEQRIAEHERLLRIVHKDYAHSVSATMRTLIDATLNPKPEAGSHE